MENHNFSLGNPLQIAIFNSYVSLPEGSYFVGLSFWEAGVESCFWIEKKHDRWDLEIRKLSYMFFL